MSGGNEHVLFAASAGAMLKARHAAERLQGAWHGGVSTIDQLRARMQDTLDEFGVSCDEAEARSAPPLVGWQPACTCGAASLARG